MKSSLFRAALFLAALALVPIVLLNRAHGSDHADTPAIAKLPGTDLTDVFIFPSPSNANNVVLVMTVHPLIPSGMAPNVTFDPNVLYQFKIDNTGDYVEDYVIQAKFIGAGANQIVSLSAGKPTRLGTVTEQLKPDSVTGAINTTFTTSTGIKVFAGGREDPFFFDLNQFFTIFPDRASGLEPTIVNTNGQTVSTAPTNPNQPMAATWRAPGQAQDGLVGLNVLAIVVEVPRSMITGTNGSKINLWCTTSI